MAKDAQDIAGYYDPDGCDLAEFTALIDQEVHSTDVPHASAIEKKVPIYDVAALGDVLASGPSRQALMAEWAQVFLRGAGVIVLKGAYANTQVLDDATSVYEDIIAKEKEGSSGGGDHFLLQ